VTAPESDAFDRVQAGFADAIADVLGRHERCIPTKWIVLCEVISDEADRALWVISDREQKPWDTLGMLHHAIQVQQAATTNEDPAEE
jgi:hypothetical protein